MTRVNVKKLKADIHSDTEKLRKMKATMRQSGYTPSIFEYIEFFKAKKEATIHHSIAAQFHGNLHLKTRWSDQDRQFHPLTGEDQLKLIKGRIEEYYLPPEPQTETAEEAQKSATM